MCKLFAATLVLLILIAQMQYSQSESSSFFGSDKIGLRLVDGPSRCQGRLEIWRKNVTISAIGQVYCDDVGSNEARVICRKLNCGTEGASVVSATKYNTNTDIYHGFGYVCNGTGNEPSLIGCLQMGFRSICSSANAIGIECSSALALNVAPLKLVLCLLIMAVVTLLL